MAITGLNPFTLVALQPIFSLCTLRWFRYRKPTQHSVPVPCQGLQDGDLHPIDKAELYSAHPKVDMSPKLREYASIAFAAYQDLLQQAAERLPKGVKVVLLADRGFVHTDAMAMMTRQLGWHYRIRLKRDTWIWRVGKGWRQLKDFHLNRGEALCFHTVKLHKGEWFGPVHVAFGHNNVNGEFWAIVSDEPTSLHIFEEYGLRFDIEENFLDDQSNGWNVQKSEVRSVCALSRLWFILAVATLYVTAPGLEVVAQGRRRWVPPTGFAAIAISASVGTGSKRPSSLVGS